MSKRHARKHKATCYNIHVATTLDTLFGYQLFSSDWCLILLKKPRLLFGPSLAPNYARIIISNISLSIGTASVSPQRRKKGSQKSYDELATRPPFSYFYIPNGELFVGVTLHIIDSAPLPRPFLEDGDTMSSYISCPCFEQSSFGEVPLLPALPGNSVALSPEKRR